VYLAYEKDFYFTKFITGENYSRIFSKEKRFIFGPYFSKMNKKRFKALSKEGKVTQVWPFLNIIRVVHK